MFTHKSYILVLKGNFLEVLWKYGRRRGQKLQPHWDIVPPLHILWNILNISKQGLRLLGRAEHVFTAIKWYLKEFIKSCAQLCAFRFYPTYEFDLKQIRPPIFTRISIRKCEKQQICVILMCSCSTRAVGTKREMTTVMLFSCQCYRSA